MADFARSMILFAGAGIDATLKQLTRDCLRLAIKSRSSAAKEFEKYVDRQLARDGASSLARVLCSPSPRDALIEQYSSHLTSGSLQSSQQIALVAASMGVDGAGARKPAYERLFKQRNLVAHELDLLDPDLHGAQRRGRSVSEAWMMAEDAYRATLDIIERVGDQLD